MAHAKYFTEVTQRLYDLLNDARVGLLIPNQGLYYGDQDRYPVNPAVAVEAGEQARPLVGALRQVENQFEVYILIYHSAVESTQTNKRDSELFAVSIAELLDANPRLERGGDGGIVIHGHIASFDPGYSFKANTLYRAVRLTWNGKTKTQLGA